MVKFFLPNFYNNEKVYIKLADMMRGNPDWFYDEAEIGAVYGSFPGAVWNGGRPMPGDAPQEDEWHVIADTLADYNTMDIPVRFTWTNTLLTEDYFQDELCNRIMQMASNGKNEVIVADDKLEKYLREKYPRFRYISSTTKCLGTEEGFLNEIQKDYYLVVLDWRLNRNYKMLESMTPEECQKTEILVNSKCYPDCPYVVAHYASMCRMQLEQRYALPTDPFRDCKAQFGTMYDMMPKKPMMLTAEDIYGRYKDMGFTNWKIEGRDSPLPVVVESIVYYMVKPEHRDKVRLLLLLTEYE